jgi:hypothetical protein
MSVTVRGGDEELRRELGPGATVLPLGAGPWEARLESSGVVPAAADG